MKSFALSKVIDSERWPIKLKHATDWLCLAQFCCVNSDTVISILHSFSRIDGGSGTEQHKEISILSNVLRNSCRHRLHWNTAALVIIARNPLQEMNIPQLIG
jgi:hypothetical protein